MEDDYGSNVYAGLEKVSALERFCYKGFLKNSSGTKIFVRLKEVSALEDVRFREVPLYLAERSNNNISQLIYQLVCANVLLNVMDLHVRINSSYGQRILRSPSTLFPLLAKMNAKDLFVLP